MKRTLQNRLARYQAQIAAVSAADLHPGKYSLAGAAALATAVAAPLELGCQIVAGNLGAPTRTVNACVGGAGNLGVFGLSYCAIFDFDGDGVNELQLRYYASIYAYPYQYFQVDPLLGTEFARVRVGNYLGGAPAFPASPVQQNATAGFQSVYGDEFIAVPLSGGNGFGFLIVNSQQHAPFTTPHPVTGQFTGGTSRVNGVSLWGAQTGISNYSDIVLEEATVSPIVCFPSIRGCSFPVELSEFTARAESKRVVLDWTTATETDNSGFEVERSLDGETFALLGFVEGRGTSQETNVYTYSDDEPPAAGGRVYYRLRQIDFDGASTYGPIRDVEVAGYGLNATVSPNPTSGETQVRLSATVSGAVSMELYSPQGQRLGTYSGRAVEGEAFRQTLDLSELPAGVYFLKIAAGGKESYARIVR